MQTVTLKANSVFYGHANVIITDLRSQGLPEDILEMVETPAPVVAGAAAAPGPCGGILANILAQLPTILAGCIPVAKTPAGLVAAFQKIQLPLRGIPLRTRLVMVIRDAITKQTGNDPDGHQLMNALATPLKDAIVRHVAPLQEPDAAAIIDEVAALQPTA